VSSSYRGRLGRVFISWGCLTDGTETANVSDAVVATASAAALLQASSLRMEDSVSLAASDTEAGTGALPAPVGSP
jgi:hypothetical protein